VRPRPEELDEEERPAAKRMRYNEDVLVARQYRLINAILAACQAARMARMYDHPLVRPPEKDSRTIIIFVN